MNVMSTYDDVNDRVNNLSFIRTSVMTFNVWGDYYWPQRQTALLDVLKITKPDILLLQESSANILKMIDTTLTEYDRVHDKNDDDSFGWISESNILWNKNYFSLIAYGRHDIDMTHIHPKRGLFWVILNSLLGPKIKILCCTAHFPWVGVEQEVTTNINQRINPCLKCCDIFTKIIDRHRSRTTSHSATTASHLNKKHKTESDSEKVSSPGLEQVREQSPSNMSIYDYSDQLSGIIFTGDFNDDFHPLRLLNDCVSPATTIDTTTAVVGGFQDVFTALDVPPPCTHPGTIYCVTYIYIV